MSVMAEARLERLNGGLAPTTDGWFVVNAREGAVARPPGLRPALHLRDRPDGSRGREDVEPRWFEQLGFKLGVIGPGQPSTLYHAETQEEAFLILAGTCTAVLEDEVRGSRPGTSSTARRARGTRS